MNIVNLNLNRQQRSGLKMIQLTIKIIQNPKQNLNSNNYGSNRASPFRIIYPFEQLARLPENTDFTQLPQQLIPVLISNQWEQQLQALTLLRQLNKQYPLQMFHVIQNFYSELVSTLSGSPKVSKYAIQTLTEMLYNAQQCQLTGFGFSKFMEGLIFKTLSEQKSVALLAQSLLYQIIQNQYSDAYDNFIMMLIDLICTNKNVNVAENAVKSLAQLIAQKGLQGLQSLQMETLGKMMQFISKLTVAKRKVFQTYAVQIADYMLQLTGGEVFQNILSNLLQQEDQQNLINAINSMKTKNNQGALLSVQLRQHIREVKKSHLVSNNMKEIFGQQYQQNYMPLQQIDINNLENIQNIQTRYNQQMENSKTMNFNYSFGPNSNEHNMFYQNQQQQQPSMQYNFQLDKQQQMQDYQMQQNMGMNQYMN